MSGRRYTYSQLDQMSKLVAAGFLRSGLQPGQVVSLVLPNIPEFLIAALGAFRAGLTVSTINPLYNAEEILYQLQDSDSSLVITISQKLADVRAAVDKVKGTKPQIGMIHGPSEELPAGIRSFQELFQSSDTSAVDKVRVSRDSVALLLYSSGTTGLPKGVRLTHKSIIANLSQVGHDDIIPALPTTKSYQDVTACVLPFFHVYGLVIGGLAYLARGLKLVTLPKFEPQLFLSAFSKHKTTIAHVVPPMVQFLANHPMVQPSHLDTLRVCTNGAAALSPTDARKLLEKKKDIIIASGYGLTESSPVITAPKNTLADLDSVGFLIPNSEIKIIDPDKGDLLDPSKPGEICARGPQIMDGYHKNKEATEKTIIDGWLHTGDIGYISQEGKLMIIDRLKELIKVKGFQVAPLELEELLRTHPGVADVGVVGKPDSRLGETPVAFVVPKEKKPSAQELKDLVASKVAEYKQISDIIFVDTIPKNLTGKILRRKLKEQLPKGK